MAIYYAETGLGCCLHEAKSIQAAHREVLEDVGKHAGIQVIHKATQKEIDWVEAMRGSTP